MQYFSLFGKKHRCPVIPVVTCLQLAPQGVTLPWWGKAHDVDCHAGDVPAATHPAAG